MNLLSKDKNSAPYLFLAPMEGVGDRPFRKAMSTINGFDEAVTEFMRVPVNAHVESLARVYEADELGSIPLAAQIMGSDPELMAGMARQLEKRGAKRIDLNCGCPSNTVTGKGAGSSLLKTPDRLHKIASFMVKAVQVPVTLKMRSGYSDTSLFRENLKAAEESGVKFITLHPRTKEDGYGPPAKWDLIAEAKSILKIPLVGNGDILTVEDALRMLHHTRCDALMIGRGAVINPFIFKEIKAHFAQEKVVHSFEAYQKFYEVFVRELYQDGSHRGKINKLKQIFSYQFRKTEKLKELRPDILKYSPPTWEEYLAFSLDKLKEGL